MLKEDLKMSWMNVIHNKMRSTLTILGIIIGVGSIIALITIVKGVTSDMTSDFATFKADRIIVSTLGTPLKKGLIHQDIESLAEIDNVAGVSPTVTGFASIAAAGAVKEEVSVIGRNDIYFSKNEDVIEIGRGINPLDIQSENKVSLIGSSIAQEMFYGKDPIGENILIGGINFTIIGTLQQSHAFSSSSINEAVIVPYTTSMQLLGTSYIMAADVYMEDTKESEKTTHAIEAALNEAFKNQEEGFSIRNTQEMLSTINGMITTLSLLLVGISSISLIVGGIGIMNMMLVSVTERTAEIGLRKALGAEPKRIQQQFLMEAVFLSLIGGSVGVATGILAAFAICSFMGTSYLLSSSTVFLALGFSSAIGIIFGYAPARKASKLNPIDALRNV
ncbi:ABC transporter permease [Planomicrobium sp. CPCC 101079]|uniref:ABC transporter permease n=1 Tax=Planomicrobium sp. CPCC 101079 TaxID=2599618 RepID=UPI0011B74739|nr:ABC transporter permease [Planomicrobium sp. CPCC 101079]TWT14280.1 FtsX-like permease family protein [Planomicrobium sp. CPCC 101079]